MNPNESGQPATLEELTREIESLRRQLEKAQAENERLRKEREEALRAMKRQAAPFSRRKPKKDPKRPGRKEGADYGKQANRTEDGAQAQKILMSVLRTCHQQGKDSFERILELLRSPVSMVMDIVANGGSPQTGPPIILCESPS